MNDEIRPVPKKMKMKRRYACPVPCDAKCVVEMTTEHVQVHIFCPCGCGWVQGWEILDETAVDERHD